MMRAQHATIIDALSGKRLDTLAHCVPIELTQADSKGGSYKAVKDVEGLAKWLLDAHVRRLSGDVPSPTCVLLTAGPAAGKTCLMSQLVMHAVPADTQTLEHAPPPPADAMVPILIRVQDLQKRLLSHENEFSHAWNWVDAYLRQLHGESSEAYRFLRQVLMARRGLLLLDGIDEGGTARERIERHLATVLAPQGHLLLLTSRPNGVTEELFAADGFHTLQLKPLTDGQQQSVVERRLAGNEEGASLLMRYIRSKVPKDAQTGARVTGNPLMLSMVMSIFESHHAKAEAEADGGGGDESSYMPKTITELYGVASSAMLDRLENKQRGGEQSSTAALRELIGAVFFQAHAAERRIIRVADVEAAAVGIARPEELAALQTATIGDTEARDAGVRSLVGSLAKEERDTIVGLCDRVQQDRLPLLSLIQASPLEMQSSHLSFQEFYAARAICAGYRLPPEASAPWRWSPWWHNTLRLGQEIGEQFQQGLLRSAHCAALSVLDIRSQVGGDRSTSLTAIALLLKAVNAADLRDNLITDYEAGLLAATLTHAPTASKVNLAGNLIHAAGARHIGLALAASGLDGGVVELDLSRNALCVVADEPDGKGALTPRGGKVAGSTPRKAGTAGRLGVVEGGGAVSLEGLLEIGRSIASCGSLATLRLSDTNLSDDSGRSFVGALALRPPLSLTLLDLSGNGLGSAFCRALPAALAVTPSLSALDLSRNPLGAEGGVALSVLLKNCTSLLSLDLGQTNMCDCSVLSWSEEAISELASALREGTSLTELSLVDNALCGLWTERICGESVLRGTYTNAAVGALLSALGGARIALSKLK